MGFFSRFFNRGTTDTPAVAGPEAEPERVSEMGLDAKAAQAVLNEIDIDTAIAAHENWKLRLQNYLNGTSSEVLLPEVVCLDDRCDLGKWLHGPGQQRLGKYPAFSVLIARHKYFHIQASSVVAMVQTNDKDKATQTLEGSYRYASSQVVLMLKDLKRGLGR